MRKTSSVILLLLVLGITPGCSVKLVTMNTEDERLRSLPHRALSEMPLRITKSDGDPNKITIRHINNSRIQLSSPCRIKYQSFYFDFIGLGYYTGGAVEHQQYYNDE